MHEISILLEGEIYAVDTIEVSDAEALPLYLKLKEILRGAEQLAPSRRGRRRRTEEPVGATPPESTPETPA